MSKGFAGWQDGEPRDEELAKYFMNWVEVEELVNKLYSMIPFKPKAIVAISRGGLIPGVMLSHLSGCRNFHAMRCTQYEDKTHVKGPIDVNLSWEANVAMLASDTIVVEDIVDSGSTMNLVDMKYPNPYKLALVKKAEAKLSHGIHLVYARIVPQTQWLTFPWELSDVA